MPEPFKTSREPLTQREIAQVQAVQDWLDSRAKDLQSIEFLTAFLFRRMRHARNTEVEELKNKVAELTAKLAQQDIEHQALYNFHKHASDVLLMAKPGSVKRRTMEDWGFTRLLTTMEEMHEKVLKLVKPRR